MSAISLSELGDVASPEEPRNNELSTWELLCKLGAVGLPAFPTVVVGVAVGLVPMTLISRLHNTDMLAAIGLCNVMTNILGFSWIWGFTSAINTISSQDWGAGCYHSIGITAQRALVITLVVAVGPLICIWLNSAWVLDAMGQPPEVVAYVGIYTKIRIPGLLAETISCCVGRTLASIGNTRISLVASVITAIANVTCGTALIPWLHFEGAAISATLGDVIGALVTCTLAFCNGDFRRCWPGFTRDAFSGWLVFLKLSVPSFLLLATEAWTWTLQDFLAGLISAQAMAANAIAPQIVVIQYAIGSSLSTAASTVIGNSLGEERAEQARRTARLSMLMVPVLLIPTTILVLISRYQLPLIFSQDAAVDQMVRDLLLVTQVFCIFDSHQATLTGILIGVGKQAIAAPLIIICYWIVGVPIGIILAFGFFGGRSLGLQGLWFGMVIAVVLHVISFGAVVWRVDWDQAAADVKKRHASSGPVNELQSELVDGECCEG